MAHRHAMRRGGRPVPTDADLRLWRRLMVRAEVMARAPEKDGKPFSIAAEKARKLAVLPVGCQLDDGNPFSVLARLGCRWLPLTLTERMEEARAIPGLVERCGEILEPAGELTRTRKDIDG